METINEFATKYAQDKYLPVQTCNAVKAGANYVLDVIEEFIEHDFVYDGSLKRLIEQLKK